MMVLNWIVKQIQKSIDNHPIAILALRIGLIILFFFFCSCRLGQGVNKSHSYAFCDQTDEIILIKSDLKEDGFSTTTTFKLLVEVDFECAICMLSIRGAYHTFEVLKEIQEIDFWIITNHNHLDYVKLQILRSLEGMEPLENIWICSKEHLENSGQANLVTPENIILATDDATQNDLDEKFSKAFIDYLSN